MFVAREPQTHEIKLARNLGWYITTYKMCLDIDRQYLDDEEKKTEKELAECFTMVVLVCYFLGKRRQRCQHLNLAISTRPLYYSDTICWKQTTKLLVIPRPTQCIPFNEFFLCSASGGIPDIGISESLKANATQCEYAHRPYLFLTYMYSYITLWTTEWGTQNRKLKGTFWTFILYDSRKYQHSRRYLINSRPPPDYDEQIMLEMSHNCQTFMYSFNY